MFISLDLSRDLVGPGPTSDHAKRLIDHGVALGPSVDREGPFSLAGLEQFAPLASRTASPLFLLVCAKALRDATPHGVNMVVGLEVGSELVEAARWCGGKPLVFVLRDQPSFCVIPPEVDAYAKSCRCLVVSDRLLSGLASQITSSTNAVALLTGGDPVVTLAIAAPRDATVALALAERLLANDMVFSNFLLEISVGQLDDAFLGRLVDFRDWRISAGFSHILVDGEAAETIVLVFSKQTFAAGIRDRANIVRDTTLFELLTRPCVGRLAASDPPTADRTRTVAEWSEPARIYRLDRPRTCLPDLHPYFAAAEGTGMGGLRGGFRRRNVYVRAGRAYAIGNHLDVPPSAGLADVVLRDVEGAGSFPVDHVVDEPILLLVNDTSGHAYFHYMIDHLPKAGVDGGPECRHLLFGSSWHAFHRESFDIFGLREPMLCDLNEGVLLRDAILPSPMPRSAAVDFLRDRAAPIAPAGGRRRLYVTRRSANSRRVVNEDDLLPVLASYGFETVESEALSLHEQIALFKAADLVCGAHGAGLTNIAFAPPGTRIVEFLIAERFPLGAVFWDLACAAGQPYHALIARLVPNHFGSPSEGDLFVEPALLEQALRAASAAS